MLKFAYANNSSLQQTKKHPLKKTKIKNINQYTKYKNHNNRNKTRNITYHSELHPMGDKPNQTLAFL